MKIYSCKSHCYASRIAKDVDCTYSHTVRIIQIFEKSGLLIFEKTGRTKTIQLTKKGRKIAENLNRLISSIRND